MKDLNLEQFLEQYNQDALNDYRRYLNRHNIPKKGDTVKSLVAGFGGMCGQVLTVIGRSTDPEFANQNFADDYIILQRHGGKSLAKTSIWWQQIEVVS
jgi:hypothetical protein